MLSALCTRGASRKIIQLGDAFRCKPLPPATAQSVLNCCRALTASPTKALVRNDDQDTKKVNNDFSIIYKFPHIRLARGICRLKLYQTAATTVAVPVVGYLTSVGTLSQGALVSTLGISSLALCMLLVMGEIFRKLIGHMYCNSTKDLVKISHLTFFGGRRDIVVPTEDIIPFQDATENPSDIYVRVLRYSNPKEPLYMCLRFGGIKDLKSFVHVFGELEEAK